MSFLGEIKRRKVFQVAAVYLVASWLIMQVVDVVAEPLLLPAWFPRVVIVLLAIGFPLAIILSWAFDLTASGVEKTPATTQGEDNSRGSLTATTGLAVNLTVIGVLAVLLVFVGIYVFWPDDRDTVSDEDPQTVELINDAAPVLPNSVAVLPFDNLSPDPDNAFFASGLHDEILSRLAKLGNLSVISRTSVLRYAESDLSLPEIANELNVETIMEGSVRYADDRVRITTQLIDASTDEHLWSETYEREFSDIFAIESDIAMNIANALQAAFSPEEQALIEQVPTSSPEAYEQYLRAIQVSGGPSAIPLRIAFLDQAIDADPEFGRALAYRAFFRTSGLTLQLSPLEDHRTRRTEQEALALEDIDRALSIDPTLGVAYAARAFVHARNWRGREALEAYEDALRFSSNDAGLIRIYADFLTAAGRYENATRLALRSLELDPNSAASHGVLGRLRLTTGDYEGANAAHRDSLRINPNAANVHWRLCLGLILSGNLAEAEAQLRLLELQIANGTPAVIANTAYAFARLGLREESERVLDLFEEIVEGQRVPAITGMIESLARGDESEALEWLRQGVELKEPYDSYQLVVSLRANLFRDPILDRSEFVELREQLGFTDL